MASESPVGSRKTPWYRAEPLGRVGVFYKPEAWKKVYIKAENEEKRIQLERFRDEEQNFRKALEQINAKGGPSHSLYTMLNRAFYRAKLYHHLMEQTEDSLKTMEDMKQEVDKVMELYEKATKASSPETEEMSAERTGTKRKEFKQPPRTGTKEYFLTPQHLKRVESAYDADEWTTLVEAVAMEDPETMVKAFQGLCHQFQQLHYDEWSDAIEAKETIVEESMRVGRELYFKIHPYHHLIKTQDTDNEYQEVLTKWRNLQDHNERLQEEERNQAAASFRMHPPRLQPGMDALAPEGLQEDF